MSRKKIVVAVSGGFDPLHIGHVRLFKKARAYGDKLVVIINNDHWLRAKKGFVFMADYERKEVIAAIACVDKVVLTSHRTGTKDMSVCAALRKIKPHVFANGGDRFHENVPEVMVCNELGTRMVFNVGRGGKVQSSSWLIQKTSKKKSKHVTARK